MCIGHWLVYWYRSLTLDRHCPNYWESVGLYYNKVLIVVNVFVMLIFTIHFTEEFFFLSASKNQKRETNLKSLKRRLAHHWTHFQQKTYQPKRLTHSVVVPLHQQMSFACQSHWYWSFDKASSAAWSWTFEDDLPQHYSPASHVFCLIIVPSSTLTLQYCNVALQTKHVAGLSNRQQSLKRCVLTSEGFSQLTAM